MQYQMAWPPFTKNIKITILGLVALFLLTVFAVPVNEFAAEYMWLSKDHIFEQGYVWTLLSYALFHADFNHMLFNGLALWIFGGYLDQRWSTKTFWTVSLSSALGGGVAVVLSQLVFGGSVPTLGYSGAVMGLVGAYCWYHWDRRLNFFFVPMTGKTLLLFFVVLDIFFVVVAREPISIAGHLGGMATGLLLVTDFWRPRRIKQWWRRRSMKKKFRDASREVDRKRNGKWIN
ncbi:MAG: rhomboid family intramembrane serine protease [Persicimonas sp.]